MKMKTKSNLINRVITTGHAREMMYSLTHKFSIFVIPRCADASTNIRTGTSQFEKVYEFACLRDSQQQYASWNCLQNAKRQPVLFTCKFISRKSRLRVHKSFMVLNYGYETWSLVKNYENILWLFGRKYLDQFKIKYHSIQMIIIMS